MHSYLRLSHVWDLFCHISDLNDLIFVALEYSEKGLGQYWFKTYLIRVLRCTYKSVCHLRLLFISSKFPFLFPHPKRVTFLRLNSSANSIWINLLRQKYFFQFIYLIKLIFQRFSIIIKSVRKNRLLMRLYRTKHT